MQKDIIIELDRTGIIRYVYEYKSKKTREIENIFEELVKANEEKSFVWYDMYYRKVIKARYVK